MFAKKPGDSSVNKETMSETSGGEPDRRHDSGAGGSNSGDDAGVPTRRRKNE